jgi:hypothetical protein
MSSFLKGDKLEIDEKGEIVLVERPGWICDGTIPAPVRDSVNPNVHVLFNNGDEGVGYVGAGDRRWRVFSSENERTAIANYAYCYDVFLTRTPVVGWKPVEAQDKPLSVLKLWDRVWSYYYGSGTVVCINAEKNKPYTVLFDEEDMVLHSASERIYNMPDNRCYFCTLEPDFRETICLSGEESIGVNSEEEVIPNSKYEIGDRTLSARFGKGTIVKLDGNSFLVIYDAEHVELWGYGEIKKRCRWEEEDLL